MKKQPSEMTYAEMTAEAEQLLNYREAGVVTEADRLRAKDLMFEITKRHVEGCPAGMREMLMALAKRALGREAS